MDNLEHYLCKMGILVDTVLLLRLLLHKLSWDLGLVVKKRATVFDPRPDCRAGFKLSTSSLGRKISANVIIRLAGNEYLDDMIINHL